MDESAVHLLGLVIGSGLGLSKDSSFSLESFSSNIPNKKTSCVWHY